MLTTRRLALPLALAVILTAAAIAPTASAQVEVTEEFGPHCSDVFQSGNSAVGGCLMLGTSSGPLALEAFGALVSGCSASFDWRVDESGHGYIYDQVLTGSDCTTPPCGSPTPGAWEAELAEATGAVEAEVEYCLSSGVLGTLNCHVTGITVDTSTHEPSATAAAAPCEGGLGFVHLTGHLSLYPSTGVEIQH